MKLKSRILVSPAVAFLLVAVIADAANNWAAPKAGGRIFLMMVWDGLRPDLVDPRDTPNLFALEREGVQFAHQHAVFPTLTMVDAAVMATGGEPGRAAILGDSMYL